MANNSTTNPGAHTPKSFVWWIGSVVFGCVAALLLVIQVVPAVFGVVYRDPASVWMFAGIMDVLIGGVLLPVFVVVHAWLYFSIDRSAGLIAIGVGLLIHLSLVCVTWYLLYGWDPVLRAA